MKKSLIFIAVCSLIAVFGYIKAEQGDYSTMGYSTVGGYSLWRVNSSGHLIPGVASTFDIGTSVLPVKAVYAGSITNSGLVTGAGIVSTSYHQLYSRSAAQIVALTPTVVGQEYYCSDCSAVAVCISTGTGLGAFALITNKGTACS